MKWLDVVRVRSRKGIVHLAYTFDNGRTHAHTLCLRAKLADGRITTRGKVTCPHCIEARTDRNAMLLLRGTQTRAHPITNSWRAATRQRDGKTRYLAHWVLEPSTSWFRTDIQGGYRLAEHRLYVEHDASPPNFDAFIDEPIWLYYYCPICAKSGEWKGPDGRPFYKPPLFPTDGMKDDPLADWLVQPRNVSASWNSEDDGVSLGYIAINDATIHETGRKMPTGVPKDRFRRFLTGLRDETLQRSDSPQ